MEDWRGEKGKPNSVARIVNQDPYGCFVNDGFETNDIYQVVNYSLINKIPKTLFHFRANLATVGFYQH